MKGCEPRARRGGGAAGASAFTILEILIASTLLVLIAGVAYGSYVCTARWYRTCQDGFRPYVDLLKADRILRRVLAAATPGSQKNPKANFDGDGSHLGFTTHAAPGTLPKGYTTAFVEISHDPDEGMVLRVHPYFNLTDKESDDAIQKYTFPQVTAVAFKYLDGHEMVSHYEAVRKGKLPALVEVTLTLGPETASLTHVVTVLLPDQSPLPIVGGGP